MAPLFQADRQETLAARPGIAFSLTLTDPAINQHPGVTWIASIPEWPWLRLDFHCAYVSSAQGPSLQKKKPQKQVLNTRYTRSKLLVGGVLQDLSLLMDCTFVPLCMDGGTERLQERHNPAWQGMSQNVSAKQAEQRTRERWEWSRKLRIMDKLMNQRYWK